MSSAKDNFVIPLVSGGVAGLAVDVSLFPLDTLKTRLQAPEGFLKAGGFKGIYNGLLSAAVGSAPGAALFFATYETQKSVIGSFLGKESSWTHMTAAGCGEVMACLVRVPTENVKQNLQAGRYSSTRQALTAIAAESGGRMFGLSAFYTGYWTTCMREIPFSFIQFPMWEGIKSTLAEQQGYPATSLQSSFAGSFSGGVAAALTTPLDVIKTRYVVVPVHVCGCGTRCTWTELLFFLLLLTCRLMLKHCADGKLYNGPVHTFQRIMHEEGSTAFMKGVVPRVFWISLGGFVFFGAYEKSKIFLGGGSGQDED